MRKLIITISLISLISMTINANSGPPELVYVGGTEILVIDDSTPISILHEHLLFEMLVDEPERHDNRYRATATYTMINESDVSKTVKMVFPYSANMSDYSVEDVTVEVNGVAIPFETYIGMKDETYDYPVGEPLEFDFQMRCLLFTTKSTTQIH